MKKWQKVLSSFVVATVMSTGVVAMAGCDSCDGGEDTTKHTHSYTWVDNNDGTHNGTCSNEDGKCDAVEVKNETHVWDADDNCEKCDAVKPVPVDKVTVTFYDGTTKLSDEQVVKGGKVGKPADPKKDDYEFIGWYADDKFKTEFDFNSAINVATNVYAKFDPVEPVPAGKVRVTFDTHGGSKVDYQDVEEGGKATKPDDPKKDGHTFAGWYADAKYETEFDFNTAITVATTVHARWTENGGPVITTEHTVTFDLDGGKGEFPPVKVKDGEKVEKPESEPTKDGFVFEFWITDSGVEYDFAALPVTADITLTASWKAPAKYKDYEDLVAETDKRLVHEDFEETETVAQFTSYGTAGVYQANTKTTDAGKDSCFVEISADHKAVLKDDSTDNGTALIVDFGSTLAATGTVEGYFETTITTLGTGWTFIQFGNNGTEKFGLRVVSDKTIEYRINSSGTTNKGVNTVAAAANSTYKVYFKVVTDENGSKLSLMIGKDAAEMVSFCEDVAIDAQINYVRFVSGDGNKNTQTVDNIIVIGDQIELSTYKTGVLANLKTAYDAYDLENAYTANGGDVTEAYNAAVTAINEAGTIAEVDKAYDDGIAAMQAVENDAAKALREAKAAAKAELEGYKATEIGEIAETETAVLANIAKAKSDGAAAINVAATTEAVATALQNAKDSVDSYIESLDMSVEEYAADRVEALEKYAADKKGEIFNNEYKGKIDEAVTTHTALINPETPAEDRTKDDVDTAYDAATTAIDGIVAELIAKPFAVTFADSSVAAANVIYGEKVTKPANPANTSEKRFAGWYKDAQFAATFDFETEVIYEATTIYAKWDEANVTINYHVGDEVKTVKVFSDVTPALGEVYVSGKKVVWCTAADLATEFVLSEEAWTVDSTVDVYAKLVYKTVEDLANVSFVVDSETYAEATKFDAGATIESNKMFALTGEDEVSYASGASQLPEVTLLGAESKTSLTHGLRTTSGAAGTAAAPAKLNGYVITAKEAIKIHVYVSLANNSYNSHRSGSICYKINNGDEVVVNDKITTRSTLVSVVVELKAGDELTVYGYSTGSEAKVWLFGVETELGEYFTNATVVYYAADNTTVFKTVAWSSLKDVKDSVPTTAPDKENSQLIGWSRTPGATTAEDLAEIERLAIGGSLALYPVYKSANIKVTFAVTVDGVAEGEDDVRFYSSDDSVALPTLAPKPGFKFLGWFTDATTEFTFEEGAKWTDADNNSGITAKFEACVVTIDGVAQTLTADGKVTKPADPTTPPEGKEGYSFAGWIYMDGAAEKAFDFDTVVLKDYAITSKWSDPNATVKSDLVIAAGNFAASTALNATGKDTVLTDAKGLLTITGSAKYKDQTVSSTTIGATQTTNALLSQSNSNGCSLKAGDKDITVTLYVAVTDSSYANGKAVALTWTNSLDNSAGSFTTAVSLDAQVITVKIKAGTTVDITCGGSRLVIFGAYIETV